MQSVDRTGKQKESHELWGYWVPEPAILVGPKDENRLKMYMWNWLRLRPAWLYLLALPDSPATTAKPQWWRDVLGGQVDPAAAKDASGREKRLEKVKTVFGRAFGMEHFQAGRVEHVAWFKYRIGHNPAAYARLILWEVFELGFRHELLALDRILVPLHDHPEPDLAREAVYLTVFRSREAWPWA